MKANRKAFTLQRIEVPSCVRNETNITTTYPKMLNTGSRKIITLLLKIIFAVLGLRGLLCIYAKWPNRLNYFVPICTLLEFIVIDTVLISKM